MTRAIQEPVQYGFVTKVLRLFRRDVGWVVDPLALSVSVTCSVRWAFLYHEVWSR